jgi:hypothetical protein
MWIKRVLIVAAASSAPFSVVSGQGSIPTQTAPQPVRLSGLAMSGAKLPYVPPEAGGYSLANAAPSGEGGSDTHYLYRNANGTIRVSIVPYPAAPPATLSDTMALVQASVEPIRDAIEQQAQNGNLQAYRKLNDRPDQLRIGTKTIQGYWYLAEVQGIGGDGRYDYYAAYALPSGVVRIRGALPWAAPPPANTMSPSMVPVTPTAQPAGTETAMQAMDASGVIGGTGGLQTQGGSGGAGLGTESAPVGVAPPVVDQSAAPYRQQFVTFSNDLIGALVSHQSSAAAGAKSGATSSSSAKPIPAACTAVPAATDTVTYRVYASISAPNHASSLPPQYLDMVLDAVRQAYKVPSPLRPRAVAPMVVNGATIMVPAVFGEVAFTLDPPGKLSDAGLTQSSMSHAMDLSLYSAVKQADSLHSFPAQIGVTNPTPVRFFVDISSYEPKSAHSVPLFAVRLAAWHPGSRPAVNVYVEPSIPVGSPIPTASDSALIQFAIDDRGVPIRATMRLVAGTNLEVAEAVVHSVLESRYVPAMAGTCPVNGLLEVGWRMSP